MGHRTGGRAPTCAARHRHRRLLLAACLVAITSLLAMLPGAAATSASAADFTWSGAAPAGTPSWSNTTNWVGGSEPSGSVGTLTFPALTSGACTSNPPTDTCYQSENDIGGLTANAISIDDASPYVISGNAIALGSGGISASTTGSLYEGAPYILAPITLSAAQTWSIDGNNANGQLGFAGTVTGTSNALAINLTQGGALDLEGDIEAGPVTITGAGLDPIALFPLGGHPGRLNGTDGNPVGVSGAGIYFLGASSIGSLTIAGGGGISAFLTEAGTLAVDGGVSFDSTSHFSPNIDKAGTTAGVDYSQLSASGTVNLAGAHLEVLGTRFPEGGGPLTCPTLTPGDVDTLVTTTGSLSGTFAGVPDGTTVPLNCMGGEGTPSTVRVNYTAHTVTVTVQAPSPAPPALAQTANVEPVSGTVLVRLPGSGTFVPLTALSQIPFGTVVDATHGTVSVTTAGPHGGTQTAQFSEGEFVLTQGRSGMVVARLAGGDFSACRRGKPAARIAAVHARPRRRRHVVRKLWTDGHGRFSTKGNYAVGAVQGTKWLTEDLCEGTLIVVKRDRVKVTDLVRHRHLVVRAGHSYLAKAGRGSR